MLLRIVWQVFADNRPSKITSQSTECIWFDPQSNISTPRTDCGSILHSDKVEEDAFICFYWITTIWRYVPPAKSIDCFPTQLLRGELGNCGRHLAPSVEAWCRQGMEWEFCWYDDCLQSLNSETGRKERKPQCKASLSFTGTPWATHQLQISIIEYLKLKCGPGVSFINALILCYQNHLPVSESCVER